MFVDTARIYIKAGNGGKGADLIEADDAGEMSGNLAAGDGQGLVQDLPDLKTADDMQGRFLLGDYLKVL